MGRDRSNKRKVQRAHKHEPVSESNNDRENCQVDLQLDRREDDSTSDKGRKKEEVGRQRDSTVVS